MSVIDTMRTASAKLRDSNDDLIDMDFYYGSLADWITVDLINQAKDFIWVDDFPSTSPDTAPGFIRLDNAVKFIYGRVSNKDLSKDQQEAIIKSTSALAWQYIDKLFKETNANGAKLFFPREDGEVDPFRKFSANNVYGVTGSVTVKERFPIETC